MFFSENTVSDSSLWYLGTPLSTHHLHVYWVEMLVCSGSDYDFESGRPSSSPEWGLIYYKASITAQGLPEPSSLRGSTLGTRAAEHKGCNWGIQIDWWLQPRAVFGHTFSGIIWHMPQEWSQSNCMTLSWWPCHKIVLITIHFLHFSYLTC